MRIQNNIMALNTHRQLGVNNLNQTKSTEKLSSGYRINRAADDASGLSISEKMRAQIRGLNQASANAQDGISLIQAAEGALQETHSILQRMRELAVKAANDVNETEDRGAIKAELDQLTAEVDRIAYTTEFNKKTLLNGSLSSSAYTRIAGGSGNVTLAAYTDKVAAGTDTLSVTAGTRAKAEITFADVNMTGANATSGTINVKGATDLTANAAVLGQFTLSKGENYTKEEIARGVADNIRATFKAAGVENDYNITVDSGKITIEAKYASTVTVGLVSAVVDAETNTSTAVPIASATNTDGVAAKATLTGTNTGTADLVKGVATLGNMTFKVADDTAAYSETVLSGKGDNLTLQVGANTGSDQTIRVGIDALSAAGLGIGALDVSNHANAQTSIDSIENAIQHVSGQRSSLGAVQNRLEHTVANLDTVSENLTSAESRIRDVDMAKEMMNFTKNNILQQAATAMLAQANQAPQTVLQLLR
jgi:flagellin